jgi:hypothetical protein
MAVPKTPTIFRPILSRPMSTARTSPATYATARTKGQPGSLALAIALSIPTRPRNPRDSGFESLAHHHMWRYANRIVSRWLIKGWVFEGQPLIHPEGGNPEVRYQGVVGLDLDLFDECFE